MKKQTDGRNEISKLISQNEFNELFIGNIGKAINKEKLRELLAKKNENKEIKTLFENEIRFLESLLSLSKDIEVSELSELEDLYNHMHSDPLDKFSLSSISLNYRPHTFHSAQFFSYLKRGEELINIQILPSEDNFMRLKELASHGYGLNPLKNIEALLKIGAPQILIDLWDWIIKGQSQYEESLLNKKRFSDSIFMKGILSKQHVYDENLETKKFLHIIYYYNKYRSKIIEYCGWADIDFYEENIEDKINKLCEGLEKQGFYSRSVSLAFFNYDFQRSILAINKSELPQWIKSFFNILFGSLETIKKDYAQKFDDLQNNTNFNEEKITLVNNRLFEVEIEAVKSLATGVEVDDYLNQILSFFGASDDSKLNMNNISIWDRIAFAFRFQNKEKLEGFLNKESKLFSIKESDSPDPLSNFLFNGINEETISDLQNYLDYNDDIITLGPLCVYIKCFMNAIGGNIPELLDKFISFYIQILSRTEEIESRREFIENLEILYQRFEVKKSKSTVTYEFSLNCFNCQTELNYLNLVEELGNRLSISQLVKDPSIRINKCPQINCNQSLPKCIICLQPISILNPGLNQNSLQNKSNINHIIDNYEINEGLIWCSICNHGGHLEHFELWFEKNQYCAATDCYCKCQNP